MESGSVKYVVSTIKSSFLPAMLFAGGLIAFYAQNPYVFETSLSLYVAFYVVSALGLGLLALVNHSKPFFSFLTGVFCCVFLNWCKNTYGVEYVSAPEYLWLCFLPPLDLLLFYFLKPTKLKSRNNFWIAIFLLAQPAFVQHFGNLINMLPYLNVNFGAMPLIAAILWILALTPLAIDISFKNTKLNTGLLYADTSLFLGLLYSNTASGVVTFFLSFALILCCTTILDLYQQYSYDVLENVGSYNAYLSNANNYKFQYKYTVGLFSIDNGDKLQKVLGERKMQELEQMLVKRILDFPYNLSVYRYFDTAEFIMVFPNEDAKHVMEYAENIRHVIAASEFIFSNGKSLKITISVSVSEKTRLDLNAADVTARAHNSLQKAYRFNCNIVTKV